MSLTRVQRVKPACPITIELGRTRWACVKHSGHHSKHRVEGPIQFVSPQTGLVVTIESAIEWTETP